MIVLAAGCATSFTGASAALPTWDPPVVEPEPLPEAAGSPPAFMYYDVDYDGKDLFVRILHPRGRGVMVRLVNPEAPPAQQEPVQFFPGGAGVAHFQPRLGRGFAVQLELTFIDSGGLRDTDVVEVIAGIGLGAPW